MNKKALFFSLLCSTSLFSGNRLIAKIKLSTEGELVVQNTDTVRWRVFQGDTFIQLRGPNNEKVNIPMSSITYEFSDVILDEDAQTK